MISTRCSFRNGLKALRVALEESGIDPPDTDVMAWDSVTGPGEQSVRESTSLMLEQAIASGDLAVGARGWKAQAARLTIGYLTSASKDSRAPLDVVQDERARRWAEAGGAAWQRLQASVLPKLAVPELWDLAARSLVPVRALLEGIGDGVTLTQAGYLPKALVVELNDRFKWYDLYGFKTRSEADVYQLAELHALLRKARVLTKRGRKLTISGTARRWLDDDARLFRVLAEQAMSGADFDADVAAAYGAVLLTRAETVPETEVHRSVFNVVADRWRTTAGQVVELEHVRWAAVGWRSVAKTLGLLEQDGEWDARTLALTEAGKAGVVLGLRARAYAPRHRT